jgi:hypothetical protein
LKEYRRRILAIKLPILTTPQQKNGEMVVKLGGYMKIYFGKATLASAVAPPDNLQAALGSSSLSASVSSAIA